MVATFLFAVAGAVVVVIVIVAGAGAVARDLAGAGSPRDSANSQRTVLITPSRNAVWRCSDAITTCSTDGGRQRRLGGPTAPLSPLGAGAATCRRLVDGCGRSAGKKRSQCRA